MDNESQNLFGKAIGHLIHDIRNPLNVIVGFSSIIKGDADLPEETRDYLNKIYYSGIMIEDMLSDIDAYLYDNLEFSKESVDISGLLNKSFEIKDIIYPDSKIKFCLVNKDTANVEISALILKKIIDNLYTFSRKGLRTVSVKDILIMYEVEGEYLRIIYSDSGQSVESTDDYFSYEDIINAKRGLGLLFVKKYIEITDSKIVYLKGSEWQSYINRIGLDFDTEHGFVIKYKL